MQLTRLFSAAAVAGAMAVSAHAQTTANQPRAVSLDECIQMALKQNLDVQVQRINPLIARYTLNGSYAAFEPSFDASFEHRNSSSPGGIDQQGRLFAGRETESDAFQLGVSGLLPTGFGYNIGTRFSDTYGTQPGSSLGPPEWRRITLRSQWGEVLDWSILQPTTFSTIDELNSASAFAGITMAQPLLKDFWIDAPRYQIALNRKNLQGSELDLEYLVMQVVSQVQMAYYDLIAAREQVKVQEKALEVSEQLLRENQKRVQVGVLDPLSLKGTESEVAANRATLSEGRGVQRIRENNLKDLVTDQYDALRDMVLEPSDKLGATVQVFDRQDSWQKGLALRPDYLKAKVDAEKAALTLRFRKNQLLPALDLNGSYGQSGAGREYSHAFGGVQSMDNPVYSIGATLKIPLGNRTEKFAYRTAKAQREEVLLRLKRKEQDVLVGIDNSIAQAQSSLESLGAARKATEHAEAALDAEQKKLENGKSTPYEVILKQRDLTMRRSQEITALTAYNKALAGLALSEGSTLDRAGIRVETK